MVTDIPQPAVLALKDVTIILCGRYKCLRGIVQMGRASLLSGQIQAAQAVGWWSGLSRGAADGAAEKAGGRPLFCPTSSLCHDFELQRSPKAEASFVSQRAHVVNN